MFSHFNQLNSLRKIVCTSDRIMCFFSGIMDIVRTVLGGPDQLVGRFGGVMGGRNGAQQSRTGGSCGPLGGSQGTLGGLMSLASGFLSRLSLLVSVASLLIGDGQLSSLSFQMPIVTVTSQLGCIGFDSLFNKLVGFFGKAMRGRGADLDGFTESVSGLQREHGIRHLILGLSTLACSSQIKRFLDHVMGLIDEPLEGLKTLVGGFCQKVGMLAGPVRVGEDVVGSFGKGWTSAKQHRSCHREQQLGCLHRGAFWKKTSGSM